MKTTVIDDSLSEVARPNRYHFTADDLRKWCLEYDDNNGTWPESELQGLSVYEFIMTKLGEFKEGDWQARKIEWEKELELIS